MYTASISFDQPYNWIRSFGLVIGSSILISLFAKAAIFLPFSPVPIALQPHLILLLSFILGSRLALLSVASFLMQGACGFPVFASGMSGLFGSTSGYLIGYLIASFIVGYLAEKNPSHSPLRAFTIMASGNLIIFLFGVSYLSSFIGLNSAILLGFLPFILGDILKLTFAVKLLQWFKQ